MIYIDTGAFLARYVQRDQYYRRATGGWKRLVQSGRRSFTSNLVVSEAATLIARRAGYKFAAQRIRLLLTSQLLTVLRASQEDELQAVELMEKYADQEVSFVDCVSFVLMRKHHMRDAFTFDRHFEHAGFQLWL